MSKGLIGELDSLGSQVWQLANAYRALVLSVERAQEQMDELLGTLNAEVVAESLERYADEIARLELNIAQLQTDLSLVRTLLETEKLDHTLRWKQSGQATQPDPATGRTNKDYTEALLQQHLGTVDAIRDLEAQVANLERELAMERAELEGAKARFSAARHRARLAAAMLVFLSEPAQALGRLSLALDRGERTEREEEI